MQNIHPASVKGMTLISLMVGIMICLISSIALMSIYRTVVYRVFSPTVGSQPIANANRQTQAALLSIQASLQSAGFGIASAAAGTNFILVDGAQLAASAGTATLSSSGNKKTISNTESSGNAIFWEENKTFATGSSDYGCEGIISDSATNTVYHVSADSNCHPVSSNWSSQSWSIHRITTPDVLDTQLTFIVNTTNDPCTPFKTEVPSAAASTLNSDEGNLNSSASATAGLQVQIKWNSDNSYTNRLSCLINFR